MMQQSPGTDPGHHGALDRRAALRLFVSGAVLALASCARPAQQIVPYVDVPAGAVPGVPSRFATALPLAGYGRGVVATSVEGRPIKINGNPRHPSSLGATDIFAEAAVLSLYDPDRSKAPYSAGRIQPWSALTGALADHRVALRPEFIRNIAIEVARTLGAPFAAADLPADVAHFVRVAAADLATRKGAAIVQAGPGQSAEVHALCHWTNAQLSAPLDCITPVDPVETGHGASLRALSDALKAKRVDCLIVIGANPAYDTPGELAIAEHIAAVPFSVHLGVYRDETGTRCTWHLPQSHTVEAWSDIRAIDGTASIIQPLIRPLYDTRTAHDLLALFNGTPHSSPHELVHARWRANGAADENFDDWWRRSLQDGLIAGTAAPKLTLPAAKLPEVKPAHAALGFVLTLAPDPAVFDGSVANNAWLQECPKPFSKQVWGNALHIAEDDARDLGLVDGDMLRVASGTHVLEAPVIAALNIANLNKMARLWAVVLLANFAGTLFAALFSTFTPVISPDLLHGMLDISRQILGHSWPEMFFKGIAAGFLIAALVWLIPGAESAQFYVIVLMTYLISVGNFAHIVAGSVEAFLLVLNGDLSWLAMMTGYLIPVLAGNIVGGTALFALIAYAQVVKEI